MIKYHLQCLSHRKTVHLGSTTVKVKEQKTLLHRHAILLAFSDCVMKWRWYCEWKCECNAVMWLKCHCCTLQCCDLEVLKYFRPLFPHLSVVKLQQGGWLYLKWSFDSEESTVNTAWSTEFLKICSKTRVLSAEVFCGWFSWDVCYCMTKHGRAPSITVLMEVSNCR